MLILLTDSNYDRGVLRDSSKWPYGGDDIVYVNCDTGQMQAQAINSPQRVLCIIKTDNRKENTDRVKQVLNTGYSPVVGVHTTGELSHFLDVACLSSVIVSQYSTTRREFQFVQGWCKELANPNSNFQTIQQGFDRLFDLLLIPQVHSKLYELLAAFLPLHLELQLDAPSQLSRLVTQLQENRNTLSTYLDTGNLLPASKNYLDQARDCLTKMFQHIDTIHQYIDTIQSGRTSSDLFNQFHETYCQLRDHLLSLLEQAEASSP